MEKAKRFDNQKDTRLSHVLRLYVTGASPNSVRAITNIKNLCEDYLKGQYDLNIIDVYQQPQIAQTVDIIALPMLVIKTPLPERKLIGDMSDKNKLIRSLGILNHEG
jgi:circadian clock protein KaiB